MIVVFGLILPSPVISNRYIYCLSHFFLQSMTIMYHDPAVTKTKVEPVLKGLKSKLHTCDLFFIGNIDGHDMVLPLFIKEVQL